MSINTATVLQIGAIPNVGLASAANIIDRRNERGSFQSWDEVGRIRGIGVIKLLMLQKHFGLDPSPSGCQCYEAIAQRLERVPTMGRTSAWAILSYRTRHGPIPSWEHVRGKIRGVGDVRILQLTKGDPQLLDLVNKLHCADCPVVHGVSDTQAPCCLYSNGNLMQQKYERRTT
eukprot:TRINITY_DN84131_c0_g1_i1.p1 TRINITY_DN84131_c0_g1~~TRINITY_DN84131_c0_g1_i1.p1  ORF type:complete len:182 (-),score=19.37 TRINITY_DN84131_c0_g1_i1:67-588(-)